ncbi:Holliday junction resolvase RuvX [Acuticoccus sp. I52.16.1]|uniref:Holliday junction resolvase RuvX n=1 Tax=Acuticoccus sp. I52.16.1 TaxID=2928472 RepID=UPI001FD049D5|nr:Holliday junction resolvase RuvX [Acuticoccus sp. I52.16.1]UOM33455.1 Holliday junction resolvase RuvX [Acuticoccus sp. I52.16.1]
MTGPFLPIEEMGHLEGALFGLDFGTKTIGIAVSDEGWRIATPLQTIRRTKFKADSEALLALATRYNVAAFVVGLPLNMDGTSGPRAQSTRDFARNMAKLSERPMIAWDERWSTVAAERALIETDTSRAKRRESIDKMAATIILQGALDRLRALDYPLKG